MEDKQFRDLFKEQTDEIQRHQKMLLEEFSGRLKVIAEVQTDHTRKIDAVMEMVAMNTEQIDLIKSMLKRRVDIDEFENLEKRVIGSEKKLRTAGI